MSSQRSLREIADLILARKYLVAGITLSIFLVVMVASAFLPGRYESFTRVRVTENKALWQAYGKDLAGVRHATERVRAIHEEILSRSTMEGLIRDLNLDRDLNGLPERERLERREALIRRLLENTKVELTETNRNEFVFRISHTCPDPARAQKIVSRLSTDYRNRQYSTQKDAAARALQSIRAEVAAAREEQKAAADALASFEEEHHDYRFGQPDTIPDRLAAEQEKRKTTEIEVRALERQLADIRTQMKDEPEWTEITEKVGNEMTVDRIKQEIRDAERELHVLKQVHNYTDEHPKVIAQREFIEKLRKDLGAEEKKLRTVKKKVPNPMFQQLKSSEMDVLSALTVKRDLLEEYVRRERRLEALARAWPELSRRWEDLRDRKAAARAKLEKLLEKEQAAKANWQAKMAESAIVFEVLDPPVFPLRPSSPNRILVALAGLLLGLGVGVGSVLVLDGLDHSFRYTEEVAAMLDVPVLGSIAAIETLAERAAARRRKRLAAVAVAALALLSGGVVFLEFGVDHRIHALLRGAIDLVR